MKQRIEYIDAMRGFTMILVVFSHVLLFSFGPNPNFSFNSIFITFRMPLFFALSGFLMYKPHRFSHANELLAFSKKKFVVQIIPTVIITLVYVLVFNKSYIQLWESPAKEGYWFTVTLFWFFIIYSFSSHFFERYLSEKGSFICGAILAFSVVVLSDYSTFSRCPWYESVLSNTIGIVQFKYYIYFFLGILLRWKYDVFISLMENKWFAFSIVVIYIILQVVYQKTRDIGGTTGIIRWTVLLPMLGIIGVIILFGFFKKYEISFTKDRLVGRLFQYVGERTLDVYLLHYFFLPQNLHMIGSFLATYHNPLLELFLGLFFAILVVLLCLVTSRVVRISDILAKLLFGKIL